MKTDLYTKAVLTVIAFMLVMIGCHQYISPATAVKAEGPFAGIQFTGNSLQFTLFDPRTGDIWEYKSYTNTNRKDMYHTKIPAPGVPVSSVQWGNQ
jgi:hypothetical protein